MPEFERGKSGNRAGRPKGSKNKATADLREVLSVVLSKEMTSQKLKNLLKKLDPPQRLNYLIKLTDFVLPRLSATNMDIKLDRLSDEQINELVDNILKQIENEDKIK